MVNGSASFVHRMLKNCDGVISLLGSFDSKHNPIPLYKINGIN
jgi:hypothetical protein